MMRGGMTNYWILVIVDGREGGKRVRAADILKQRFTDRFFGINERTRWRRRLKRGDRAVIYLGGSKGQKFVGNCTLASDPYKLGEEERVRMAHGRSFLDNEYGVRLGNIEVWEKPRSIRNFLSSLDFIIRKEHYGLYLQGSVRPLSEADYRFIVGSRGEKD
jgi:hypothetical protein